MANLDFPLNPTVGQLYPNPAVPGQAQYSWSGQAWVTVGSNSDFVRRTGDSMAGHLGLPQTPAATQATRKDYVDAAAAAAAAAKVDKTGDIMTGHLTINEANPTINLIKGDKGTNALIGYSYTTQFRRWEMHLGNGVAEAGNAAGTNFALYRYDDAGNIFANPPIVVTRNDGNTALTGLVAPNIQFTATARQITGYLTQPFYPQQSPGGVGGTMNAGLWIVGAASNAYLTFYTASLGGINFGMGSDYNLYYGGGNLGANAYKVWSTRDFTALPNVAPYVQNARLVYAADYQTPANGSLNEPYPGSVVTGINAGLISGSVVLTSERFRYLQLLTAASGWFTIGFA